MSAVAPHPGLDELVDYWLGDTDAARTEALDAHLMQCDACGALLDEVIGLARGVREAFAGGGVAAVLSAAFVERLRGAGRRVREYRVPHGGSVNCTLGPDDELLVGRVAAPLAGVARLDAVFSFSFAPGLEARLADVPFDPAAGEVLFAPKLADIRAQPVHELVLRLVAVDDAGEREVGRYTFRHRAPPAPG